MKVIKEKDYSILTVDELKEKLEGGVKGIIVQIYNRECDIFVSDRRDNTWVSFFSEIKNHAVNTRTEDKVNKWAALDKALACEAIEIYWFPTLKEFCETAIKNGWK